MGFDPLLLLSDLVPFDRSVRNSLHVSVTIHDTVVYVYPLFLLWIVYLRSLCYFWSQETLQQNGWRFAQTAQASS
jgi:hypothetical protein